MKKINRSPTTDINFDKNASYNDNFADWLTEMVDRWAEYYTGCTFEIRQVGTEGTQVEIESKPKPNITFDCSSSLNTDLSKINKITYTKTASESRTYYIVTWKTESKETPKKEDSKPEKKSAADKIKRDVSRYAQMFGGLATGVVDKIRAGVQAAGLNTGTDTEPDLVGEHQINKRLLEEIDRIKELLK